MNKWYKKQLVCLQPQSYPPSQAQLSCDTNIHTPSNSVQAPQESQNPKTLRGFPNSCITACILRMACIVQYVPQPHGLKAPFTYPLTSSSSFNYPPSSIDYISRMALVHLILLASPLLPWSRPSFLSTWATVRGSSLVSCFQSSSIVFLLNIIALIFRAVSGSLQNWAKV